MTTMTTYRDDSLAAALRYDDLLEERLFELPAALALAGVRERRVGRIAAGITGLTGMLGLVAFAISLAMTRGFDTGALGKLLFGTWGAMGIAYALGRAGVKIQHRKLRIPKRSDDRWTDVARLEEPLISTEELDRTDRLERASVALPLMATALLAPLTLHAVVYAAGLAFGGDLGKFAAFDGWIALSLVVVGQAHVVLAVFGYRFASKLRSVATEDIDDEGKTFARKALWWTVLASAVPGAVLYLLPPVLTLLTGLVLSPAMFWTMSKLVIAERETLDA
jgi:hypothetical protein